MPNRPRKDNHLPSQNNNEVELPDSESKQTNKSVIMPTNLLWLVGAAFSLSGFAALTYEVVWQRVLVRVIGATTPASAIIICAFMGGLGLGAVLGANFGQRKNLLRQLASIEILIFMCALVSSQLCDTAVLQSLIEVLSATAGDAGSVSAFGFLLVFLLVFIPTSLMGATFPIIADFASQFEHKGSGTLLKLYAINSTGAVFGAFVSGFLLMPASGIEKTLMATGCFNLVAAVLFLVASNLPAMTKTEDSADDVTPPKIKILTDAPAETQQITKTFEKPQGDPLPALTILMFATGAMSFAMEIIWTRFLVMILGSSTYALSLMLTVFIAGLANGAWVAEKIGKKTQNMIGSIAMMLALASSAIAINLFQYQATPSTYLTMKKVTSTIGPSFWNEAITMILLAVFLIFLAATVLGTIFPLALGAIRLAGVQKNHNKRVSLLYSSNIAGSMVGAFGCGVLLLPRMSENFISAIEQSTFLISAGYILASQLILLIAPKTITLRKDNTPSLFSVELKRVAFISIFNMLALALHPQWDSALLSSGLSNVSEHDAKTLSVPELIDALSFKTKFTAGQSLLMYREGTNSTISVVSNPRANLVSLRSNGKVEAAIPMAPELPAPESDLPTQKLLGLLPSILCSSKEPMHGLVIGYGTGTTCSAAMSVSWVKQITAVELEHAIWDARQFFQNPSDKDNDSKLRRITGDARNFISLNSDKYDFIVSQPAEPWLSGASDLFTVEFYQLAKSRLKNTGMFCQWIPLYSLTADQLSCLLNTFKAVFPEMKVWHSSRAGELIVTAQLDSGANLEQIKSRIESTEISNQLQQIGLENEVDLLSNQITYPPKQPDPILTTEQNTDDNLLVEGMLARAMYENKNDIEAVMERVFGKPIASMPAISNANVDEVVEQLIAQTRKATASSVLATDAFYLPALGEKIVRVEVHDEVQKRIEEIETDQATKNLARLRLALHTGDLTKAAQLLSSVDVNKLNGYAQLCDVAAVSLINGKYEQSLLLFTRAEKLKPFGARALAGKGLCHWQSKRWNESIEPLKKSLRIDPNQFLARYALGQSMYQLGANNKTEALSQIRAAGVINPESSIPGLFVSAAFIESNELEMANANQHLVMRKRPLAPDAIALGIVIDALDGKEDLSSNLRSRYREITASDITLADAKLLVETKLSEPCKFWNMNPK